MSHRFCNNQSSSQQGFTLVELVAVIVLLSIIAVASTQFIRQGVGIYTDSVGRDRLQQQARFAIERMSRELRNALPGSVRTSGDGGCVEFVPIEAASSYITLPTESGAANFSAADFAYTSDTNHRVVVYPIDDSSIYLPAIVSPGNVAGLNSVAAASGQTRQVNLDSNHQFTSESTTRRFYIVSNPVSFCVRNNQLYRHSTYNWISNQSTDTSVIGDGVLLAENIQTNDGGAVTVFDFTPGTPQRSGVIHMDLRFSDTATLGDEWLRFSQEVFVRNTP